MKKHKIVLLCISGVLIIFGIVFIIVNYRSLKQEIRDIFGVNIEEYKVISKEDSLKWYRYQGTLTITIELSEGQLADFREVISKHGYSNEGYYHDNFGWTEFDYYKEGDGRDIWCAWYRTKGEPRAHVRIKAVDGGYVAELSYSE